MSEERNEAIEVLEKQITEKVIPFCKDNQVPLVMYTDKATYLLGTNDDLKNGLYSIMRGQVEKGVIDIDEVQKMVDHIRNVKGEHKPEGGHIALELADVVKKFTDEIDKVAKKYDKDFADVLHKVIQNLNKAWDLCVNGGELKLQ